MTDLTDSTIPYEGQRGARDCGAAALCMVYRSFGLACSQDELWQRLARPGPWDLPRANTHQLAADALRHGLAALVLQVREPWRALEVIATPAVRVILNHRDREDSPSGHYTVVVGMDGDGVLVHDPARGPGRRLSRAELGALWRPGRGRGEVTGHVLAAFAKDPPAAACPVCRAALPPLIRCPCCGEPIPLRPAAALGCATDSCPARTWQRLFCPACDMGLIDVM